MNALEIKSTNLLGGAYLLEGNDDFLINIAENAFRAILPPDSLSLYFIDKIKSISEISSTLNVYSFDGSPNVVIIRDTLPKLDDESHKELLKILQSQINPNYLVFRNCEFLNAQEKKLLTVINCEKVSKPVCLSYIENLFPYGINNMAANVLADYMEYDLAKIKNESIKLIAYCGKNKITLSDVEALVTEDKDIQVFAFVNNIVTKNFAQAIKQLEKMRLYGYAPAKMLSTLINQFQRIFYCAISPLSNSEIAKVLGIKEYAVKKAREIKGFSKMQLKNTINMLLEYEYKFKIGEMSDSSAFNCAVSTLLSKE